ncbi:MAG: O-antigen ligase family protein [Candidatus Omnitrophica bacterium]|nr:O-antigen ligase family protein [Candidatus Omnitrophota bacterium]
MSLCALIFFLLFFYPQAVTSLGKLPFFFSVPMGLLFLWIAFQGTFISLNVYATGTELVKWTAFATVFLLIQLLPEHSIIFLMAVLVLTGVLESAYGLFEVLARHEKILWKAKEHYLGFVTGTYFNRNHFAGLLELCLGIHLGLGLHFFRNRNYFYSLLLRLSSVLVFTAFFYTGSRMGILSFFLSFFISLPFLFKKLSKTAFVFALFVCLAGGLGFFFGFQPLFSRLDALKGSLENWEGGRFLVWQDALRMLTDHLWQGIGLGSFEWIFPAYQSKKLLMGWAHAHNDYLELAIELGLPGFLVLVFSFSSFYILSVSKGIKSAASSSALVWGASVSTLSLLFHAVTDFNFSIPANMFLWISLNGMVFKLLNLTSDSGKQS